MLRDVVMAAGVLSTGTTCNMWCLHSVLHELKNVLDRSTHHSDSGAPFVHLSHSPSEVWPLLVHQSEARRRTYWVKNVQARFGFELYGGCPPFSKFEGALLGKFSKVSILAGMAGHKAPEHRLLVVRFWKIAGIFRCAMDGNPEKAARRSRTLADCS